MGGYGRSVHRHDYDVMALVGVSYPHDSFDCIPRIYARAFAGHLLVTVVVNSFAPLPDLRVHRSY